MIIKVQCVENSVQNKNNQNKIEEYYWALFILESVHSMSILNSNIFNYLVFQRTTLFARENEYIWPFLKITILHARLPILKIQINY